MFTFLDTVMPRGGGTMVVTGSHHLLNDGTFVRSRDIKKRLRKKYKYFHTLTKRDWPNPEQYLSTPSNVDDIELQVAELHGEPGDVYLMDLRLLHTISTNTASIPRLMVTQRYHLEKTIHSDEEK